MTNGMIVIYRKGERGKDGSNGKSDRTIERYIDITTDRERGMAIER